MSTATVEKSDTPEQKDLFGAAPEVKAGTKKEVVYLELTSIEPDPDQPRKDADSELEASIRQEGVLQPISVRDNPDPAKVKAGIKYRINFGERRFIGSVKSGRTTIPAIIDNDTNADEARRLVRQVVENTSKPLEPMEEATVFARIQKLTGASVAAMAKMLGKPKSTIGDRLALAEAPAAFQPLFASGELSPSAGPLVRPYADVPEKILTAALKTARSWYPWNEHYDGKGGAVPLDAVARILRDVICGRVLREIPSKLDLVYQGARVTIDKKEYATDVELFEKTSRAQQQEEEKAARAKASKAKAPTPAPRKELTPSERKAKDKAAREAAAKALEDAKWKAAAPKIVDAVIVAIKKAPASGTSVMATELFNSFEWGGSNLFDEMNFSQDTSKKVTKLGVPRGRTAEDWIRHLVVCLLHTAIDRLLNDRELDEYAVSTITAAIDDLELKVDVKKILTDAKLPEPKVEKKPAPAKKAAKKRAKR